MTLFADFGVRNVIVTDNALIASTLLADGHYPEINQLERDRLLAAGWTINHQPRKGLPC